MNEEAKEAVAEALEAAGDAAVDVARHRWMRRLSRLGFYSKGFLYIVVGAIAIAVVAGVSGAKLLDQRGALAAIAAEPYGKALLIVFVAGALGHGIWNILRGVAGFDGLGRKWLSIAKRTIAVAVGIFYLGLSVSALEIFLAARVENGASQAEETFVGLLLITPFFGAMWAVIIGIGLVVGGLVQVYVGLTGQYQEAYRTWQIDSGHKVSITVLAWLSFSVRAALLVVLGWFFIKAPFNGRPGPIGLDAALLAVLGTSYGRLLVAIAGVGLISHGILAFYESKYRRIC